jgi:hypothetical protein
LYAFNNGLYGPPDGTFRVVDPGDVLAFALGSYYSISEINLVILRNVLPLVIDQLKDVPGPSITDGLLRLGMDAMRFGHWLVADVTRNTANAATTIPGPAYYDAIYMVAPGEKRFAIPRIAKFASYLRTSTTSPFAATTDHNDDSRSQFTWLALFASTLGNTTYITSVDSTWDANQDFVYTSGTTYDSPGA